MALKVLEQKKNPLLKREEAWLYLEHPGSPTPTRKDLVKDVARSLKAKEDVVIVDKIFSEKGRGATKIKALVFSKKDDVPKALKDKMGRRMKVKKEGEVPAEAKEDKTQAKPESTECPEKPAEEKKEETPEKEAEKEKTQAKPGSEAPSEEKPKEEGGK